VTHNIFRDGKVHVLSEECATCIFKPHERPVVGARVAELVRGTIAKDGSTVVCHSTLFVDEGEQGNAVCRGWFDRLGQKDNLMMLAEHMNIVEFQKPPEKEE